MEQAQFEQAVLRMVHSGGADRLTPNAVAYQMRLSVKDAERMLDKMVTNGALELDSDDDGNLFYFVPGLGSAGVFTSGTSAASPAEIPKPPPPQQPPYGGYGQPPANQWGQQYGGPPHGPSGQAGRPGPPGPPPHGARPGPPPAHPGGYGGAAQAPYGAYAPPNPSGRPPASPYGGYGQPPGARGPGAYGYPPPQGAQPNPYGASPASYGQPHPGAPGPTPYAQPYPPPGNVPYGHNALVPISGPNAPKSPGAASILSAFFPGAGQLYNGHVGKGLGFFFACTMLAAISPPLVILPWMWSVVDAYAGARRTNQQQHYGLLNP